MNDTIVVKDSLNTVLNTNPSFKTENVLDWWMLIAVIELFIIIVLLFKRKKETNKTKKQMIKEQVLSEEAIDFNNIINSSFNAKQVYDQLIRECHPDRFPNNPTKQQIALNLSQEVVKNKGNLNRLEELRNEVKLQLNL